MWLFRDNIQEWKAELRKEMFEQYGQENYDETVSNEDWINDYEGCTVQEAIDLEVENWEPH